VLINEIYNCKMDMNDWKILEIIEDDARIPISEIAVMLDMKEEEIRKRIKNLRERGIIRRFKTNIDWKKTGKHIAIAIIQVKVVPQERSGFSKICMEISKDERVKDVFVATGEYDLILVVEGRDIDDLSKFVTEKLAPKKDVMGTYTHIVLEEYKRDGIECFDEENKRLKVSL